MKRILGFGKDMVPRKQKPKSAISKKPRPYRKLKMPRLDMSILNMMKEMEEDADRQSELDQSN
jgi:hypothetical protein